METAGVPVALMEIPRWTVQLASRPKGVDRDSAFVVFSGAMRQTYPVNAQRYLESVKDRLVSKHKVDLSENFLENGFIVIELKGYEIDYVDSWEGMVLFRGSAGGISSSPQYVEGKSSAKSKSHSANVYFFDTNKKLLWGLEVAYAKKPKQVADAIAKLLRRPSAR